MSTIPASAIVNVIPSVLSAGGNALNLSAIALTQSHRVPLGTVQGFATAAAVSAFFGPTSVEASLATIYFNGFIGSTAKPGNLFFAEFTIGAVWAYLRGGSLAAVTLAQLQGFSGTFSVTVNGVLASASINLAGATSFANAASIIGTALGLSGPQVASFNGTIVGGTLTVNSITSGTLGVGQVLTGTGVTVGTSITANLSGGTGVGSTWSVTPSQSALAEPMTSALLGVDFDSVTSAFIIRSSTSGSGASITFASGALATLLLMTQATGAVISQGAAANTATTVSAFMAGVVVQTQNWATFMLGYDPDQGVGNAIKLAFMQWVSGTANRYAFICWDTDPTPSTIVPAPLSLGGLATAQSLAGTTLISHPDYTIAAFVCGAVASIDFTALNGRATLAFKSQAGLIAGVTTQQAASNLIANGYNFYGAYATANQNFVFFYPGSITGPFLWLDSYVDQIWLNAGFQLALVTMLTTLTSIPYNAAGLALIENALAAQINQGLSFGAFRAGITLSASQTTQVNNAAGRNIAPILQQRGWYLQVLPASPAVRAARGSPPANFWYMDGQAVQQITLNSIELQ